MLKRVYEFNKAEDMIDLAQLVQTKVYWNYSFRLLNSKDEETAKEEYKYFWDYCSDRVAEGYTKIEVNETDNEIRFIQ